MFSGGRLLVLRNYLIDFEMQVYTTSWSPPLPACFVSSIFVLQTDPFILKFFPKTYHFSSGVGGLAYLGIGIGFIIAMIFGARFADRIQDFSGSLFL